MPPPPSEPRVWQPTKFLDFEESVVGTNMRPARVMTDAGRAYLKPMEDGEIPHGLAIEWVCTRLAQWFGLPVLDHAILNLGTSDVFPRPTREGNPAQPPNCLPGPAFATRAVDAVRWDGGRESLARIGNSDVLARIVIFDTWIRNEDRYPPINSEGAVQSQWRPNLGNVLFVREPPKAERLHLVAMDFGHAITKGKSLPSKAFGIYADKNEWIYGLYPEFRAFITPPLVDEAVAALKVLDRATLNEAIRGIPTEWDVSDATRTVLSDHLYSRAGYVSDTISARLEPLCFPQGRLPGM